MFLMAKLLLTLINSILYYGNVEGKVELYEFELSDAVYNSPITNR